MPRPEKVAAVNDIKDRLSGAQAVFLAEYSGLSVKAQQSLRRGLRAQGAEFQVVKMTLARRAAAELELDELDDLLIGPTGLAFADGDAVAAAKVLKDFAAANDVFTIKGGLLGTTVLTAERIRALAEIEPREVLLAKLAGLFQAPAAAMAGLLAALPRGAATMFQALVDKRSEGMPVVEPAASDEPAETNETAELTDDIEQPGADAPDPEPVGEAVETEPPAAQAADEEPAGDAAQAEEPAAEEPYEVADAAAADPAAAAATVDEIAETTEITEIKDETADKAEEEQ